MTRKQPHFKQALRSPEVDLHCHSTASDGTVSPAHLVEMAGRIGLRALALTDHDSVAGLPEFLAPSAPGLLRLTGVEVSCREEKRQLHLVGLCIRPENRPLLDLLAEVRQWRQQRNRQIASRLVELGLPVPPDDLAALVESAEGLGRPHLAAFLVRLGICRTLREAFQRYLGRGKPAYVPRRVPTFGEAVQAIHGAGGVAIWAHPLTAGGLTVAKFQRLTAGYAAGGLDGLEAHYSEFTAHQTQTVERIALGAELLVSGGSDFHGEHIPDIALGTGYGNLHVPESVLEPILDLAGRRGGLLP